MSSPPNSVRELLMVGMSAKTYRVGNAVRKECHVLHDDDDITKQNMEACHTEADIYLILGSHPLIAEVLSMGSKKDYVELQYYPEGNLVQFKDRNRTGLHETDLTRWGSQMIASIAYIHSRGVKHSDLRLEQWLVDEDKNLRLSDFNGSGFSDQPHLGLKGRLAQGLESPSHCLPRDPDQECGLETDIFALGSSLYELEVGHKPYEGLSDQWIETLFQEEKFPSTDNLLHGDIIEGCWRRAFRSAKDILQYSKGADKLRKHKTAFVIGNEVLSASPPTSA